VSGTYNLTAGTLQAQTIQSGNSGATGTINRTFNWTAGTIQNSGTDMTISPITGSAANSGFFLNGTTVDSHIFKVDSGRVITVNAAIGQSVAASVLTKSGSGILILTASNSFTGATTIAEGKLRINGALTGAVLVGSGTGSGALVNPALSGTGIVIGLTTTQNSANSVARLAPGVNGDGSTNFGGAGTLNLAGGLVLGGTSALDVDLATPNVTAGTGNNDLIATTSLTINTGVTVTINDLGGFAPGTYHLITYSGSLTDLSNTFQNWSVTNAGVAASFSSTGASNGSIDMIVTAVPEPGTWATLLGGISTLIALRRLRRR
jgi:fibronectin-binding autotransporter adhesin